MSILNQSAEQGRLPGHHRRVRLLHAKACLDYGTKIVAGVTPGRGGQKFESKVPIYDTVEQAVKAQGADVSCIFVPPIGAADAIVEAVDAGCKLVICITEGIPVLDMVKVRRFLEGSSARLVGPIAPVSSPLASARLVSCLGISTRRAISASCPSRGRSPMRRLGSSPRSGSGNRPAWASVVTRWAASISSTCSTCSIVTRTPTVSS